MLVTNISSKETWEKSNAKLKLHGKKWKAH